MSIRETNGPNVMNSEFYPPLLSLLLFPSTVLLLTVCFSFSSSSSVWKPSPMKTSPFIIPAAPTCHESAVIETLIIPHKTTHAWKTERERDGPISIPAAARLPGVSGGPRDLIWRRLWELKSYLSQFIAEEQPSRRIPSTLFMLRLPAPANHCGYYNASAVPTYCQNNGRISDWFLTFYCSFFFPHLEKEASPLTASTVGLKRAHTPVTVGEDGFYELISWLDRLYHSYQPLAVIL